MASYGFHSEAAEEYLAATRYYLEKASPLVAAAFVAEIEAAIQTLLASPATCPVIETNPSLLAKTLSVFALLSVGVGARSNFHLCSDAFQPSAWLLARSNFHVRESSYPQRANSASTDLNRKSRDRCSSSGRISSFLTRRLQQA